MVEKITGIPLPNKTNIEWENNVEISKEKGVIIPIDIEVVEDNN